MKRIYLFIILSVAFQVILLHSMTAQCDLNVTITADPPAPFCTGETVTLSPNITGGTAPYTYVWETGETTPNIQVVIGVDEHVTLDVTDDNGCTDEYIIKLSSWMDVVSIEWASTVCEGEELEVSVYISPITPGAVIEWSNGQSGLYNYITNSGTYAVTVTNPDDGCSLSDTADIAINFVPSPDPQIMGPSVLCQGQSATLSINVDPNDFILWSTGSQQTTTTINGPGTYTVLVSNSNFCTGYDTLVVSSGGTLPLIDGPPSLCMGQGEDITVTNAANFNSFAWSNGGTTPVITVNGPGTYSVTVSDGGGCTATGSFTIATGSSNINFNGSTTAVTSCTTSNGAVDVTISPTGTYTFNWSNGATSEDLANIAAGSYTVTATDNGGCTASASFAVANNTTPPVLAATATPDTCSQNFGAINQIVSPAGAYTFLWSNGATNEDLTNIAAGTYTVTTTSTTTGCTATASATVTNTTINLSVTGVVTQPTGGQNNGAIDITASPTGAYTFAWSNGATTEDLTGLGNGTYTVTVSAGGNCTATASFVLTSLGCPITVTASVNVPNPGVVCVGDIITVSSTVSGGTAPYTYNWSNGITTPSFTLPAPSNETLVLTVTDDDGCTAVTSIHIKVNVWYVDINYSPFPTCQGETLALIASTTAEISGTTYTWSTGETGFMINVTSSGTYSVSMTNPDVNCTANAIVTVTIGTAPAPTPQIAGPTTLCPGQSATLTVNGGPFSTYSWSEGSTDPTLVIIDPGTYSVTVTNVEGCTGMDFIDVQAGGTAPILNDPMPICPGQSTTVEVTNAAEFTDFLWSNGGTGPSITVNTPDSYTVTVTAAGGCTAVGSADVLQTSSNLSITGTVTNVTSCTLPNGGVDITVSPSGTYDFNWSNGPMTEDLVNLAAGTYTVTITESSGCMASQSFTVAENLTLPSLSTTVTPASCGQNNGAVNLSVSPAGTYVFTWSNGANTEDLVNLAAGTYDVTVTSSTTGCTATASATVQSNGSNISVMGNTTPVTTCTAPNGAIDITASPVGTYTFVWSNSENSEDLVNVAAGTYTVTVSAGGNCTASASFTVAENLSLPTLSANIVPAVCGDPIGAIDLSVAPVGNYVFTWSNGASTEDLTGLAPGNYTVIATVTVTGCTATATYNVPNNSSNFTLTGSSTPVTNCGAPNGGIDLSVSPSGVYDFLWSNGVTLEDLQNMAAGTYTVTVTQAGACTGEASFQVLSQVVLPVLAQTATAASCGLSNGAVDLGVTPASGNAFLWSNGATSEDLQNVPSGSYTVTVTAANSCTATISGTVPENSITISLNGLTVANSSCTMPNGSVDLTTSPTGNYDFVWSNGETTEDLQGIAAGNYSVTVSAGGNCTSTEHFTVQNNSGAPSLSATATAASCGQANGVIDLTPSPTGNYDFIWSNGDATDDLQDIAAGTYTVTCTAANGCTATASVNVPNNNTNFSLATAATPSSSCISANGEVDLTVSPTGVYDYIWSNGETSEDLQNIAAGNYAVTVTDANGCTDIASVTVLGPSAPQVTVAGSSAVCPGNSATISATAGFSEYVWSNGMTGQGITVSQPATYAVTATDVNGCTASASQALSNFPLPLPIINGPASICGSSTQFTVSGGVFTQTNWSTGETVTSITVSQSGNYTVTVTDANGCTASDSQSLSIDTSLLPSIATAIACDGTATLDAGSGYATYLWSNGGNSQILNVNANGSYAVTVSDGTGCTGETTAQISIPTPPQVAIVGPNSICQGGSAQFSVPNNFTQINWSTGAVTASITVSQPATYSVTVADANGCTASASQALTVGAGLSPDIIANLTDCNGSTTLDAGLGYSSYLWSNGSTLQNITVSANGAFTVTVTDASGCSGTASETVTIPAPPQVQVVGASQFCEGDSTVLAAPGSFVQYLWSTGETTPQITVSQGGNYTVTVSDTNGCTASDAWTVAQLQADFTQVTTSACSPLDTGTVTILLTNQFGCDSVVVVATLLAQPIFTQIELEVCEGESAVFNGVAIPAGGSHDFVFAGANGCDSTVSVSMTAFSAISFELKSTPACQDLPNGSIAVLMLGGEQPYQFSLNGGAYQTDTLFADLPPGSYTVTAQDGNGCVFPENMNIPAIPPMVVEFGDETLVCGETALLKPLVISNLAVEWKWSDSSGVVSTADRLLVDSPGSFYFTVTNACESISEEIHVEVEPLKQAKLIYLPNSFSPNDDGLNDCYRGYVDPKLELLSYELKIFDRWGDQTFETTDVDGCWDGWYRGKEMDPAVMVYWVRMLVRNCDGKVVEVFRKGDVHLMR